LCVCVVRWRSLRRADPPSRGVLPTVVCAWVWSSENKQLWHLLWVGRRGKGLKRNFPHVLADSREILHGRSRWEATDIYELRANRCCEANILLGGVNGILCMFSTFFVGTQAMSTTMYWTLPSFVKIDTEKTAHHLRA
jgi:hypothetical protein